MSRKEPARKKPYVLCEEGHFRLTMKQNSYHHCAAKFLRFDHQPGLFLFCSRLYINSHLRQYINPTVFLHVRH